MAYRLKLGMSLCLRYSENSRRHCDVWIASDNCRAYEQATGIPKQGSVFYLKNIVCHLPQKLRREFGRSDEWNTLTGYVNLPKDDNRVQIVILG